MSGQLQKARPCYGYRLRQAMLGMLLLLLIEAVLPLSVLAYEGDHYVWTYYLALHVGFNRRQAYQIAEILTFVRT